jgi:NAD(P)H-dependent FMN reductase
MTKIAIIVGTTRPGRKADTVAAWVAEAAAKRTDAEFEIVDIADFGLPLLDEAFPASMGKYQNEHTKKWASVIAGFDGFVFVTPEYNQAIPSSLKNAIDYLYAEWNNKAAGFVGYGAMGGARAIEGLRLIVGSLQIADVRAQVCLSLFTDFENFSEFKPGPQHGPSLEAMFGQLVTWSAALERVRAEQAAVAV